MASTGYEIVEQPPDDNIFNKPFDSDIKNKPAVDGLLKATIEKLEPYEAKKSFLNYTFQCDVGKLPHDRVEQLHKNEPRFRRCHEAIVDKFSSGSNIIDSKEYRSDKISPRDKCNTARNMLRKLHLPDVVSDSLSTITTITTPVS
ncbi:hypothetical protein CHS0354_028434 [Potamilus streckersoni]|uniref:Uncharacterized protein n=1 Tax=Potamilus streckersoni TaxID=2493646 RepID=A0AAE0SG61_9BIVA|nr:hypothetical protein CHS0354_028434 [Potamilus streckersoni]